MSSKEFEVGFGVDAVLSPRSIAVIGVSGDPAKRKVTGGTGVLNNLIRYGYSGRLYPVNPKYESILGQKCYPSIDEVPEPVDLVVVSVPAEQVPAVLESCGKRGCRAAVIISSGFAEVGTPQGEDLQRRLVEIAGTYGIRVLGPNNLGAYNTFDGIVASTSTLLFYYSDLPIGGIAWVSQSGALCSTLYGRAMEQNVGVGYVVTSGNECDLQAADFIWRFLDDPRVHVVGAYIEGIRDWNKFEAAAQKAWQVGKPLIVYKAGTTPYGAAAVRAHTSSEAGNIQNYRAAFKRLGVLSVETLDELYQTAQLLEQWRDFPDINSVAVMTISGGEGGILVDGLVERGIPMAQLRQETVGKIADVIPMFGSAVNPIDVTAHMMREPEKLRQVGEILEEADEVDAIIYAPTTVAAENAMKVAQDFASLIKTSRKPCVIHWYSNEINEDAVRYLRREGIPVFTDYGAFFRAMERRQQFFTYQNLGKNIQQEEFGTCQRHCEKR